MSAEIPDGAVVVARAILNSSLWTMRPEDCKVAVTCIALCNWKDRPWFDGEREIIIKRGQFVRSREELAAACRLSVQKIRTSVQHLENSGFLTRHSTGRYSVYTLPKYDFYQDLARYSDSANPEVNQRLTSDQPAPNHKQEGEEGKEGEEAIPRDHVAGLLTAFGFCKSPGLAAKRAALDDLLRQLVPYERIMAAATDPANRSLDFYEILKPLRRKGGNHHAADPGYVRDFSE